MHILKRKSGFTLLELAIAMLIIGLLLGGLLMPLASQVEVREKRETIEQLEDIKKALLGYAVIHGKLPCPTFELNPQNDDYGMPVDETHPDCDSLGILPWKVLGVPETDSWGIVRSTAGDSWTGYWRYRVDSGFVTNIEDVRLEMEDDLVVYASNDTSASGPRLTPSPNSTNAETPIFIVFSTGPNKEPDGLNADADHQRFRGGSRTPDFDDITVWMTRPILISTMISAKVLP